VVVSPSDVKIFAIRAVLIIFVVKCVFYGQRKKSVGVVTVAVKRVNLEKMEII